MISHLDYFSLLLSIILFFLTTTLVVSNRVRNKIPFKGSNFKAYGSWILISILLGLVTHYIVNKKTIEKNIEFTKKQISYFQKIEVSKFRIDTIISSLDSSKIIKVNENINLDKKKIEDFNIKKYISQYYRLSNFNDFELIESYYLDSIQRFFMLKNISKEQVKKEFESMWRKNKDTFTPNLAEIEYIKHEDYYDVYVPGEKKMNNNSYVDILNRMKIDHEGYIIYYLAYKDKKIDQLKH